MKEACPHQTPRQQQYWAELFASMYTHIRTCQHLHLDVHVRTHDRSSESVLISDLRLDVANTHIDLLLVPGALF